jgi:two-component system chemotaxis response regulator CheB
VFVVHHFPPHSVSALPTILNRVLAFPASAAETDDQILPGRIYVGRPDRHLLVQRGRMRLTLGAREHGHRPAVDPLFRSAARSYGPRVIGVVLSGTLDDGSAGLHAIKAAGGLAVVQDPKRCAYPGMPSSAMQHVAVEHVAAPEHLGALLQNLASQPAATAPSHIAPTEEIGPSQAEPAVAGTAALRDGGPGGRPSSLSCPDCGGVLWETELGELLHFRCHVGHAFSEATLLAKQADALETVLWSALRALEEKGYLSRRLAERVRRRGLASRVAERFDQAARDAEEGSNLIRASLLDGPVRRAIEQPSRGGCRRAVDRERGAGMTTGFALREHPTADRVIAIATSAGGLTALIRLLGSLPAALGAGVLVVQHLQACRPATCRRSFAGTRRFGYWWPPMGPDWRWEPSTWRHRVSTCWSAVIAGSSSRAFPRFTSAGPRATVCSPPSVPTSARTGSRSSSPVRGAMGRRERR